jgi:glutamate carboxypeptidase
MFEAKLLSAAETQQDHLLEMLRRLVECESPSDSKAGVDRCSAMVAEEAARLGGRVHWHRQSSRGDLLEVRFGDAAGAGKPVLLLGHLDTVWPVGTLERMPFRVTESRVHGPGVLDMKAGVAMALAAIEMLGPALRPAVLLLVSDEEVGSGCSRAVTEEVAFGCEAVYVLEPAQGEAGAYKTARKGVGHYTVRVSGVEAHSGVDFERGHSAVAELARLVTTISGFSEPRRGVTVNVGVIGGGTLSNVVAAEAWAEVDVRVPLLADAAPLDARFRSLKVADPGCTLRVEGGLNRPPMERGIGTVRLFKQAQALARGLGKELEEASTGGGSDGNFTAAIGIPTLDGMGAVGEGAHAVHESIRLEHLAPRTALLAGMLRRPDYSG